MLKGRHRGRYGQILRSDEYEKGDAEGGQKAAEDKTDFHSTVPASRDLFPRRRDSERTLDRLRSPARRQWPGAAGDSSDARSTRSTGARPRGLRRELPRKRSSGRGGGPWR